MQTQSLSSDGPRPSHFEESIAQLPESELDAQPFGIIRLDRDGNVLSYNLYEQRLARRRREDTVGKNFFRDVAPCTRVREFYGRFLDGVQRREMNVTFSYVFNFAHGVRNVDVSLFYKRVDDSIWVIVRG